MKWSSSASTADRLEDGIAEAAETALASLGAMSSGQVDLVFAFVSESHAPHLSALPKEIERAFPNALLVGCSAAGVVGGGIEHEGERAVALTCAHLPAVELEPLCFGATPSTWRRSPSGDVSDLIVLSDSFTGEAPALIDYLDNTYPEAPKVGGLAGASGPGETSLFLGDRHFRSGSIALGLRGDIEMVTGVAQGCRPIGAPMFITRHKGPLILELDGKPALRALDGMFAGLPPEDRAQAKGRLVIGLSMAKDLEVYEQGDFLIRDIGGVDPDTGAVAVAGDVHDDQILQFHLRDADTSSEDMREVVSKHLYAEPHGALLFSCRGRGEQLYGKPGHDSSVLTQALGELPIGGFFANGEIGPVAGKTYLHAYTSAFALFRPKHQESSDQESSD